MTVDAWDVLGLVFPLATFIGMLVLLAGAWFVVLWIVDVLRALVLWIAEKAGELIEWMRGA